MPRPSTHLTGAWRYRRSLFGKMILQVEVPRHLYRPSRLAGAGETKWRNASEADLPWLRHMLEYLKRNAGHQASATE